MHRAAAFCVFWASLLLSSSSAFIFRSPAAIRLTVRTMTAQPQSQSNVTIADAVRNSDATTTPAQFGHVVSRTSRPEQQETLTEITFMKQRNMVTAVVAILLAVGNYLWQYTHPLSPVQLLATMQAASEPVSIIGSNSKPTVVDFWAPWCENCKLSASTLHQVEEEYQDRVNFVMVNGDTDEAWPLIEAFGVDAIPHLALVDAAGNVETALIGPIPKHILEADLNTLIDQANGKSVALPYTMLDVFANRPEARNLHFE